MSTTLDELRVRYEAGTATKPERDLIDGLLVREWFREPVDQRIREEANSRRKERRRLGDAEFRGEMKAVRQDLRNVGIAFEGRSDYRSHPHRKRIRLKGPHRATLIFESDSWGACLIHWRRGWPSRYMRIEDDADAILEWLWRGGWSVDEVRALLTIDRRPTRTEAESRRWLGCRFAELRAMGATWVGIHRAIGASKPDRIATLATDALCAEWATGRTLTGRVFRVMAVSGVLAASL